MCIFSKGTPEEIHLRGLHNSRQYAQVKKYVCNVSVVVPINIMSESFNLSAPPAMDYIRKMFEVQSGHLELVPVKDFFNKN